jgi:pilus assembly protein CpaE
MQPLSFIILSKNSEGSELRDALTRSGRAHVLADCNNSDQMLADVTRLRPSAAVIVVEPESSEKQFTLIKQLAGMCPDTAVITASRDASPALILGSIRSGAREFLQLPITAEEFLTVIDRVVEFSAGVEHSTKKNGRIVAVFSGKGGSGVSFLATNLAVAMNAPTLLVDLNLQNGDAASFLGLDARYSLADFVANRARLDDSLMSSLVTPHSANLSLLAAPLETHEAETIEPEDVSEVLHLLGHKYERIVLDLPHTFDPVTIAGLDMADNVLLVMTLDIPGIRSTKRALNVLERLGYPRSRAHVVVNRWTKNVDVELQKVQSHLGEQFLGFVPNDYRKVMDSINLGRPIVDTDPSSKITVEIKRIAAALVSESSTPLSTQPRRRSLRSLFSRQATPVTLEFASKTVQS